MSTSEHPSTPENAPALLPCPFCRRPPSVHGSWQPRIESRILGGENTRPWYLVECKTCYARTGEWPTPEEAAQNWNRRGYYPERLPISEPWLREVGFKWHQIDRQPEKNWVLFLGDGLVWPCGKRHRGSDAEDLAIQICGNYRHKDGQQIEPPEDWFCWLRGDTSHRYHRFLHVRHLIYQDELIAIIEAATGQAWNPANHWYGSVRTPDSAAALRKEHDRLDKKIHREQHPWYDHEKDADRGKALPEHIDAARKGGLAK